MKYLSVLIVVCISLLVACAPVPAAVPSNSTVVISALPEFPYGSVDTAGEEQPPGQYRTPKWYSVPFTFETTEAFRGMGEIAGQGQLFGLAQGESHLPPNQLLFWVLDRNFSAEEALIELHNNPQLQFNTAQTITIAGIAGTRFDAAGAGGIPAFGKLFGVSSAWDLNSPYVQIRFIVLPVKDRTLVIYIETPYDEFEVFLGKAAQVLDTIKFGVKFGE